MYRNWYVLGTVLLAMAASPFHAAATTAFAAPVTTAELISGVYKLVSTGQITVGSGPALLSGGVNLVRTDGAVPVVLGVMHDDGLNGDAVAGDGIYTLTYTASAASIGQMQLEVSAALRGTLDRVKSPTGTVQVIAPGVTQLVPSSGRQGQQGVSVAITGAYTHFAQGTTTASFGAGITVASLTINSATSATAVLNISGAASISVNSVVLTTGTEIAPSNGGFSVLTSNISTDSITWHFDGMRSGVNPNETVLTPANVTSAGFGKVAEFPVDGQIDGQILYVNQLTIPNVGTKNVVYVATENDSVYALDASTLTGSSGTVLWKTSVAPAGETAAPLASFKCGNSLQFGVTATPVIDRARNAIYVVAISQDNAGNIYDRLHALSLTTGAELFGGPTKITATYPGSGGDSQNGIVTFDPTVHHERAALLESGNNIYTVWSGTFGDCGKYSPWVIEYSAGTLEQTGVLNLAPNNYGGGMWMGGAGPAADSSGNVYVITGNGFGGAPAASYANSFVKLSTSSWLTVSDYFSPDNTVAEDSEDLDFGSAGPLLLPDLVDSNGNTRHLGVGAGKDGKLYVVDRDNMGQYTTGANANYQTIALSSDENFSTPVYFNGVVYVCPSGNPLKAFPISSAKLAATPSMQSTRTFAANTGVIVSVSANGTSNGIVWAVDYGGGVLYAFNAASIATEIYNSNQAAGSRDHFSTIGGHFITPMVSNGMVYFGTGTSLVVFGLLQ